MSCALFEKFSTFLQFLVSYFTKKDSLDHYLDDFIFSGPSNSNQCSDLVYTFSRMCSLLGVPLAEEKLVGPCNKLVFLGLELDSVLMMIRIPLIKVEELRKVISHVLQRKRLHYGNFSLWLREWLFVVRL